MPEDKLHISIHHLLTHSSGLVRSIGDDYLAIGTEDFIAQVWGENLHFEPGSAYEYSNVGYSLLAISIAQLSGQSYETYLYENLFHKLT